MLYLRYFSKLARQYLRNLKAKKMKNFNIEILNSEIDNGFWDIILIENENVQGDIENQKNVENV